MALSTALRVAVSSSVMDSMMGNMGEKKNTSLQGKVGKKLTTHMDKKRRHKAASQTKQGLMMHTHKHTCIPGNFRRGQGEIVYAVYSSLVMVHIY